MIPTLHNYLLTFADGTRWKTGYVYVEVESLSRGRRTISLGRFGASNALPSQQRKES